MNIIAVIAALLFLSPQGQGQWTPQKKTIKEFVRMSEKDTTTCELSGIVSRVRNYERGNLFLCDHTGSVLIYGIFDPKSYRTFPETDVRKGDSLTVRGRRFVYDGRVIEMKNALYVSHKEGPEHSRVKKEDELDKNPSFKGGGPQEFSSWVGAHLVYPRDASQQRIQGTVIVRFIVGMDGNVYEATVVKGVHPSLDNEALRVINRSPKWKPGIVDSHPVRATFTIPVIFSLDM